MILLLNDLLNITSDGCQLGMLSMASIGFSLNNLFFSLNSFRWVHVANFQCRSFLSAMLYLWAELVRRLFDGAPIR
jgi:hypothetical protein